MVLSYLEKLQKEYLQEKHTVDQECKKLQLCLKENIEFIKLLEETNDPNYESFTPREVNAKNKVKIYELQEQQKEIQSDLEQKEMYRDVCDAKLEELSEILVAVKNMRDENQKKDLEFTAYRTSLLEMQEQEKQRVSEELQSLVFQKLTDLVHRIELCGKLIELDANRCKLELGIVSKTMGEIIGDVQEIITGSTQ